MNFKISYAVTACDEHKELNELLDFLFEYKRKDDEVIVQVDKSNHTKEVSDVIKKYKLKKHQFELNNDFASFKNNLKKICKGDYIFQIDADELPAKETVENLHKIIESNLDIDLFLFPRINLFTDLADSNCAISRFNKNEQGWINWPDYQSRLFKNKFNIKWHQSSKNELTGVQTGVKFPETIEYALSKVKTSKKNELTIDYAILTHNEGEYIENLISLLVKNKRPQDNIIIVDDYSDDKQTQSIFEKYKSDINLNFREFDNEETQRNYLKSLCTSDYIFVFDADELMTKEFINNLPILLACNPETEMFYIPRINTVEGLTDSHIKKWNWKVNKKGWVNFPDNQTRLHKNLPHIKWKGFVHSSLSGFQNYIPLPHDEIFCMIHDKKIDRQEMQNNQYDKIEENVRTKYKV